MGSGLGKGQNIGGATTNGAIDDKPECSEGVYIGDWKHHKWHGFGKLTWNSGSVYEGEWIKGKRHGHGKMVWASGAVYEGGYKDNKRYGNGIYTYVNGDIYEGGFKDDRSHGLGTYTYHQGHIYEGGYDMGKQCGNGRIIYRSGTIIEGQFKGNRIQFGVLRIGQEEYAASFEEAGESSPDADPISIVYNVQLSSHDGKKFKPLQFREGDFLDTPADIKEAPMPQEETKEELKEPEQPPHDNKNDENTKKIKREDLHERPPPTSPEPLQEFEIDDME